MKAKTKITKLFGILLALAMVVGMLPTAALAEERDAVLRFADDAAGDYFYNVSGNFDSEGPTVDTTFSLTEPTKITAIWTYHWYAANYDIDFSEQTIQLKDTNTDTVVYSGAVYVGHYWNPNRYCDWFAFPDIVLPAGTYQLIDSHNESWCALNNKGVCMIKGYSGTFYEINTPGEIIKNGVTATVTFNENGPLVADTAVTATVTLTGTAVTSETHIVNLTSTKIGMNGMAQTVDVTAGQDLTTTPVTNTFSFTMPAEDVDDLVLLHTFESESPNTVTITNGTASVSQATAGTTVTLTADAAPSGQVFDKWVVESESASITFADANSATTTFTMPDGNVIVKATYASPIPTVAIEIDAPVSNTALDTTAVCETTGVSSTTPTVIWDTDESKAGYYKDYTASVTLTAAAGYKFTDDVAATVNNESATSVTKNANGTITVTYKFPKTDKHNIEITFDTAVSDGDTATNPTISSGYEFEFCFFVEDTDKDGVFIDETTGSAVIDDKTLVVDKALVEEFAAQSGGRFTYESLMAVLKSEFGLDELKTEFTGGYDYSVYAYIGHSDGAYFDSDEDDKVTNAIIKVNNVDITDNCQAYSDLICIMPGTCVFTASSASAYTITFDANGGSVTPASAVTGADGKLDSLPTPTRSHYSFNGWYTKASGGTKVDTDYAFNTDTTIYAHWTSTGSGGGGTTRYTVSFETNGGSKVSSKTVTRNTAVSEPTAPTKDGYTFDGWYSDKALKIAYDFDTKVAKSFTLYAKWTEKATEPDKPTEPTEPTAPEWKNPFTDVKKSDWFYTNVEYAVNNKLMNGTTATTFAPSENLTRAMLIAILYRAEGEPAVNKSIPFSDVAVNAYYANAVIWAQQNGIVNGVKIPENNVSVHTRQGVDVHYAPCAG